MRYVSELVLANCLSPGYFVDICCYDGITHDETLGLERSGWKGVCIEGNPEIYNSLKVNRKLTYNAFVGERNQESEAIIMSSDFMGSGIVSNFPENHVNNLQRMNPNLTRKIVKTEHLEDILDFVNAPKEIEILKSDTEGNCLNILKTLSFTKYKFRYIACELGNNSDRLLEKGMSFLRDFGYIYIMKMYDNDIFELKMPT